LASDDSVTFESNRVSFLVKCLLPFHLVLHIALMGGQSSYYIRGLYRNVPSGFQSVLLRVA
jgi:hypothetical protein